MNILNILLMGAPQGGQGGSPVVSILFFGGMILVMWLFMIRPQTKKAKLQKQFIDNLKEGDKIVTIAGIHGKVKKMNDNNTVLMEVSPGTNFTIERSAISMEYTTAQNKA
ncbi:preprotein translocase subunit YajC [Chitinophaga solisilvae]|uniref:Sec translocon accessory complex subunit YajC n=1 Tax=Chitinophaga solisilvae TaxID=1233460 RepID=A0A3S1CXW7_9BACT|nr:preprotein translocase subunit YajC [Chitinophaga solisilvae]NSL91076.1 preprotein translocase subunit YajC [Chitinophaga solisilvae]